MRHEIETYVHRPVGFGQDDGVDMNFVDEAGDISNVLGGRCDISLSTMHISFVVVDCEKLLLVGDLNSARLPVLSN